MLRYLNRSYQIHPTLNLKVYRQTPKIYISIKMSFIPKYHKNCLKFINECRQHMGSRCRRKQHKERQLHKEKLLRNGMSKTKEHYKLSRQVDWPSRWQLRALVRRRQVRREPRQRQQSVKSKQIRKKVNKKPIRAPIKLTNLNMLVDCLWFLVIWYFRCSRSGFYMGLVEAESKSQFSPPFWLLQFWIELEIAIKFWVILFPIWINFIVIRLSLVAVLVTTF